MSQAVPNSISKDQVKLDKIFNQSIRFSNLLLYICLAGWVGGGGGQPDIVTDVE